jgi:uncharacterized protein
MKTIRFAKGLTVPAVEFATEVSANIGNRGGGKSNGAAVAVEQTLDAGVPVVILDYVGIWASLRLERDGKTPSKYQVPVLGGRHGDVALVASSGAVVAEALASCNASAIIDLSLFTKGDRCRFACDFAEAFFQAKKRAPGPVLLVLEEAQRYIPQRVQPDQARMLGAFEELAETGRNFGIGMLLISLRPQKLNKDVLNLADWLFAYRTNGVHERKALGEWVQEKGAEGRDDMADELPGLPCGTAIVWCPVRRIYGRFELPLKRTYDASATPIAARADVKIKPLDLGKLAAAMSKAVEAAKTNDPRALQAEVARLRRELAAKPSASPGPERPVEVPVVPPEWKSAAATARETIAHFLPALERVDELLRDGLIALEKAEKLAPSLPLHHPRAIHAPTTIALPARRHDDRHAGRDTVAADVGSLGAGARAVLIAVAQHEEGVTREQLTVLTGYKRSSRDTYLQRLRSAGLVVDRGEDIMATPDALAVLGDSFRPLPTGAALLDHWRGRLSGGERVILDVVVGAYPKAIEREKISEATPYRRSSRDTYLQRLGARRLVVEAERGCVRASDLLFDR